MNMETLIAQAGTKRDPSTGSISTPIYQNATFEHPELGASTGYDYSRTGNPTRTALEECVAKLEGGHKGFAFSSGMAAITSILFLFKPGDHIVFSDDLYGGTYRIAEEIFRRYGLEATYVDTSDIEATENAIRKNTRALFIETPTNPLMKITDLHAMNLLAKKYGLLTIVDNTFMTPYLQQPILLGADIVLHSASKYLGGHNDVIAGIVVTANEKLSEQIGKLQNGAGAILGPQDSWLVLRGLKTLAVRMERQQENALKIASWLKEQDQVKKVYYPGLPDHPQHEICKRQARGFGAMISFEVQSKESAAKLLKSVSLISFAESLGGVESLITYPTTQTHADIPQSIREERGINDRLLRLSVGIESSVDLIEDLKTALKEEVLT
ncbi:trans-sulfuration enzyme family protein [Peribacillus tepidiphilus]|uniref:trans-sulfuration enzyme family protein n=1 Tax=Peribacillus tepidiphilus TaxID=2652445 RepID=UPI001291D8A9|nr:PLP-dependent aspartate aminotransferase family protein [Peribacillus tepidiphilus]